MTPEEIKRIEASCVIKTKEEFVEKCNQNGIPEDWYSFTYDKTKPVCFDGNSVYYGKAGVTNHAVIMTMWDAAFKELMAYMEKYEWMHSEQLYRITNVYLNYSYWIIKSDDIKYPYVKITTATQSEKPEKKYLDDGWEAGNYDCYQGTFSYYKVVNIREIIKDMTIAFQKKTEHRDAEAFGFTEPVMHGEYCYPVPGDLLEPLAKELYDKGNELSRYTDKGQISDELQIALIQSCAANIIEDEFKALLELRDTHKKALFDSIDESLTKKEQKKVMARASRDIEQNNPANDNVFGSRSYTVIHHNFDLVYHKTGILREEQDIKVKNDRFGNKKGF